MGNDRSCVLSRGNEFAIVVGFNGKTGMLFVVFGEGSSDSDGLSEPGHAGVMDVDVLSDGEAFIGVQNRVDEPSCGDFHPLDEDVGAKEVR